MNYLFDPPATAAVPIVGAETLFPIRRIYCVGRNYASHAREMGGSEREPPFFFTKFPSTIVPNGGTIPYPPSTKDYHYEGELVIAVRASGSELSPDQALNIVYGYAAGLDMTRRDLQLQARDKGRPWDMGKNFSHSAPIAPIHSAEEFGHVTSGLLTLTVNGQVRQQQDVAELIWSCAEIISYLSRLDRLAAGDLIFTGTPAGVGAVQRGDEVQVTVGNLTPLTVTIGQ